MPMRIHTVILLVLASATHSWADTKPTKSPYPVLIAQSVEPANNAATIAAACRIALDGVGKDSAKKAACEKHDLAFCVDPLTAEALPTDADLQALRSCTNSTLAPDSMAIKRAPGTGASWQADAISGLVAFLVERAKAEALASLVDHLEESVCAEESATYMPTTCGLLANTEPYTDPVAWGTLKAAFETDLRNLPERVIEAHTSNDAGEPLIVAIQAARLIEQGKSPIDVLVGLKTRYAQVEPTKDADQQTAADCKKHPIPCSLYLFGNAVEILAPAEGTDEPGRKLELRIAARLLLAKGQLVGITPEVITSKLDVTLQTLNAVRDQLVTLSSSVKPASDAIKNSMITKTAAAKALARLAFVDYIKVAAAALELAPAITMIPDVQATLASDLPHLQSAIEHLMLAVGHARAGEYIESFVELQAAMIEAHIPVADWFSKYGGFIAEVASAKTKEDVQQALESAAAPVGAWRSKRGRGHHALTLNGYVGLEGGYEWLSGESSKGSNQYGLFAPIGLEASCGFSKTWSIGILLSVLDLGALVDVRTDDGSSSKVNNTSTIGFRQVFSPGGYLVLGLGGGFPLSVGTGISLTPELRSIDLAGDTSMAAKANALRFNVFLAVDITIFGL